MELVSCIMPTGNRQSLIMMAIDCFLRQDYPNKELIVLDDGVSPTSVPSHPSIRYFREPKSVVGAKRNRCAELSSGEIIIHFDDDDWSAPNRVSVQVQRLQESGLAFSGFNDLYFYERDGSAVIMDRCGGGAGTTQAYTKKFWESHRFPEVPCTEDVQFCQSAQAEGQADLISGLGLIVVRRHAANVWDMLNVLDRRRCTPVHTCALPQGFLTAMDLHPPALVGRPPGYKQFAFGVPALP